MISVHVLIGLPLAGTTAITNAIVSRLGGKECAESFKFCGKLAGRQFAAQKLILLDEMPHWKALALFRSCRQPDWNGAVFLLEGKFWASSVFLEGVEQEEAWLRVWEVSAPDSDRLKRRSQADSQVSFSPYKESRLRGKIEAINQAFLVSQLFNPNGADVNLLALRVVELALKPGLPITPSRPQVPYV